MFQINEEDSTSLQVTVCFKGSDGSVLLRDGLTKPFLYDGRMGPSIRGPDEVLNKLAPLMTGFSTLAKADFIELSESGRSLSRMPHVFGRR